MNTQMVKFTKANLYLTALPTLVSALTNILVTMMGVYALFLRSLRENKIIRVRADSV